jgi:sulfur carrier protein
MNAAAASIRIVLNGEPREFAAPLTVAGLLQVSGFGQRRVAVEVNREIVPKSQHASHVLAHADQVEIVHALGGG